MSCSGGCDAGPSPGGGRMGTFYPARTPVRRNPLGTPPPPRRGHYLISAAPRRPTRPTGPRPWHRHQPYVENVQMRREQPAASPRTPMRDNERPMPGREDLANSIMDNVGDGSDWNEASAMSMADYQDHSETMDDDEETCPPCDNLDDITPELFDGTPPNINLSQETQPNFYDMSQSFRNISNETPPSFHQSFRNISNETPPSFHQSFRNISNETPPSFHQSFRNISDETPPSFNQSGDDRCPPCDEESSLGLLDSTHLNDTNVDVISLAEGPSNISVYDAEELNITTAPRNADWDIPRNRIWQTISSCLDETEEQEENEYMEFLRGIHNERRSSFDR